jgi:alpha-tubulin suppressor-like RCC1 family protein
MRTLLFASLSALLLGGCSSDPNSDPAADQLLLTSISSGSYGTCGINDVGELLCWGGSGDGVLPDPVGRCGNTGLDCSPRAMLIPTGLTLRDVRTTGFNGHVCAVTTTDALYCWGQMLVTADIIVPISTTPQTFLSGQTVSSFSAGVTHDCALTESGQAFCWGDNDWNVRGTGGPVSHSYDFVPNAVAGGWTFTTITSGGVHSCALETSGEALCWGNHESVGLVSAPIDTACGLPSECVSSPVRVAQNRHFRAISAGSQATCAIDLLDEVYCWGVGMANPGAAVEPAKVALPTGARQVSTFGFHACAVMLNDEIYCWGWNDYGQIGSGTVSASILPPTKVNSNLRFASVSVGGSHTCALTVDRAAWCWGSNQVGELGDGTVQDRPRPVRVLPPRSPTAS